ncbi:MAG: App1 family protein [Spirochaetia bacterium]|nr:App1 family protein [Spirochaetia bacterium]
MTSWKIFRNSGVLAIAWLGAGCATLFATRVQADEEVIFYPTFARKIEGGTTVTIHGNVNEPEKGSFIQDRTLSFMRPEYVKTPEEKSIYERRARPFLVDNQRWKKIQISIAGKTLEMESSLANGHFYTDITENSETFVPANHRLTFQAVLPGGDGRNFPGEILFIRPTGPIIVSDIDDTIKLSDVRNRDELMRNTFARPFRATPGMPAFYRQLSEVAAGFYYVSASPWQLYPELQAFNRAENYPAGAFCMKYFRLKDSDFFNLFQKPFDYKLATIEPIIKSNPGRSFILIGDSGEKDPEAYAELAKRFPEQVASIWIRLAYGDEAARFEGLQKNLRPGVLQTFNLPLEIRDPLRLPVLRAAESR